MAEHPDGLRLTPYGDRALLLELGPTGEPARLVAGWAGALRTLRIPGVQDVVPAARSVLLLLDDDASAEAVGDRVAELAAGVVAGLVPGLVPGWPRGGRLGPVHGRR